MCGIVGYVGKEEALPILLEGLRKLEYRGYDSAGVAAIAAGQLVVSKAKGRLSNLEEKLSAERKLDARIGIGHTRWATHGRPSDENSHPHVSGDGKFALVHNGIIENYAPLKKELIESGCRFRSETDTEVVAHLLERAYTGDFLGAVAATVRQLRGSYSLGILCAGHPDEIIAVRRSSPLIVGLSEDGNFIASDVTAIMAHTRRIYHLEDGEIARLTSDGVRIFTEELEPVSKRVETVTWDVAAAEKGGYPHFLIKEIHEQPRALQDTISPRIGDSGEIVLDGIHLSAEEVRGIRKICIVACGSACHVGLVGKYVLEALTRIPTEVDVASEFRYRSPIVDEHTLCIVVSQSGETADTLAGLREAKSRGARVLSIVNVVGSSIAAASDDVLYTWAGPEISVATTKAYSTQLVMIDLIALYLAEKLGRITQEQMREMLTSIAKLPERVAGILREQEARVKELAERFRNLEHAYFIGRGLDYAVAMEGSLKLKEVSYIHSEAYAAGELKHGTISLIEEGTLVVALMGCARLFEKTLSNVKEVKARGAYVVAVATESDTAIEQEADEVIYIPRTREILMPSLEVVPLQLLGYYCAALKGCDVDKPRNLAKSVTVE